MPKLGNPRFQAARMTQAREFIGFTKRELARQCGLSEQSVSNYERDVGKPTDPVIANLAGRLNVPVSFFFNPIWKEQVGQVFWRAMRSDTLQSQKKTTQLLQWVIEAFDVLEGFVEFPDYRLPTVQTPEWYNLDEETIEEIAENARSHLGFGIHPIEDVTLALENIGIPVLALEIENPKQAGFAYFSRSLERPIIGVNTYRQSLARQRFSLAHELGHLLMHRGVTEADLKTSHKNKLIENQAHRFAAAFLFPRASFLREVHSCSLHEFAALKREWGISITAQIIRAKDLGLVSDEQSQSLWKQAAKKGYMSSLGEPWDDILPLERTRMLRRAVEAICAADSHLFDDLLRELPFPLHAMEEAFHHPLRALPANESVVKLRTISERDKMASKSVTAGEIDAEIYEHHNIVKLGR
ncbi:helix-turn-helix domain-containing protein [Limimaricola cinnabarinus]|uniref:helix-turn-helix domain-containing protein n=1 Tax=Limimaricola cinnabarinus TaxID=1125964 RepID=UPI00130E366B|nr:XRE family transcriptional regulator [Limimaricola cinnabarinus]